MIDKGPPKKLNKSPYTPEKSETDIQNVFISILGFFFNTIIFGIHSSDFYGVYLTPLGASGNVSIGHCGVQCISVRKIKKLHLSTDLQTEYT